MIKLFRKHTSHLQANWFGYALDTLVVILGILIALAVNNWNDKRKERKVEYRILTEIANGLDQDIEEVQRSIDGPALEQTPGFRDLEQGVLVHGPVHVVRRHRLAVVARHQPEAEEEGEQADDAGDGEPQRQHVIEQLFAHQV